MQKLSISNSSINQIDFESIDYNSTQLKSDLSDTEKDRRQQSISDFFEKNKTEFEINDDTRKLADLIFIQQANIFLTGFGGCGKSYQTRLLYYLAKHVFISKNRIGLCSTTGSSALNLGIPEATTIHSWCGIIIQDRNYREKKDGEMIWCDDEFKQYIKSSGVNKIKTTDLLFIDEISMLGGFYLKTLDLVCKHVRKSTAPFGGIQVVFVGDLLQLPPVKDVYPFLYKVWNHLGLKYYILKKCYRQSDKNWSNLLNTIRYAKQIKVRSKDGTITTKSSISENDIELLKKRCYSDIDKVPDYCLFLFSKNADASAYNQKCLNKLDGNIYKMQSQDKSLIEIKNRFILDDEDNPGSTSVSIGDNEWTEATSSDIFKLDKHIINKFNRDIGSVLKEVESDFEFKIGARVMLRKNLHKQSGLVNGARGIIRDISVKNNKVSGILVEFAPNLIKSSSVSTLGCTPVDFTSESNEEEDYISSEYFRAISSYQCWFYPYEFENIEYVSSSTRIVRKRIQLPFNLAWGISIHKSQGLSLLDLAVDFKGGCFCPGQAYVSLSRAKYLEKLYILNFDVKYLYSDKVAVEFDKKMKELDVNTNLN